MEEGRRIKMRVVNWSELPPEILLDIGKRLRFRADVLRFRSVCKAWRESLPCKPRINKGDSFITLPKPPIAYEFRPWSKDAPISYVLTERTVHMIRPKDSQLNCRGSCKGFGDPTDWSCGRIAEFEEILPGTFRPYRIDYRFPLHCFLKIVDMVGFAVSPISKHYGLIAVLHDNRSEEGGGPKKYHIGCLHVVDKIVILSKRNYVSIMCPIDDGDGDGDGGVVVVCALLPRGNVGLLRLLGPDLTPDPIGWRLIYHNHRTFDDIVELGGRLCVIDSHGRAYVVDSSSLELTEIAAPPHMCNVEVLHRRKRLVQDDSGDVYMLIPCRYQVRGALRPQIKVYKLKAQTREWVEVVSLGDLALFVGKDFCFAIPARNIVSRAERYRNCILFLITSFPIYSTHLGVGDDFFKELRLDVAAFDLPDGSNFRLAYDTSPISSDNCMEIVYKLPCCLAHRYVYKPCK